MRLIAATLLAAALPAQVPFGGRFETAVQNPKSYTNPYRDVSLDVTYTRPGGSTVRFWGFHDGGQTWRIRFLADRTGVWKYKAAFSDGTPGKEGTFRVDPPRDPGMLTVYRPNPIWFALGERPLLVRSLHVGDRFFAENWPAAERAAFLDWAGKQGYNMLSIASHYLNRDEEGRGKGWKTPALWPLDAAEYRKMEPILDDLAKRRFLVFPFAGFFGRKSNFPRDAADQELYARYTLARIGAYWNILLSVGGPEPNLKNKPYLTNEEVNRLGALIRRLDVFGHPLTVHNRTGDDPFREQPWLTFGTLQGPKTADRKTLSQGLLESHHASKPLYAQETLWSGNKFHKFKGTDRSYSDDDIRMNAYVILLSAAGLNFADNQGDSSSGFSGTMRLEDRVQHRHDIIRMVWDYFETVPFHRMKPRQDLVDNGFCLAEEGKDYLVYLESPGAVTVKAAGRYRAEWIDARNPKSRQPAGVTAGGTRMESPKTGADWLLRLTLAK